MNGKHKQLITKIGLWCAALMLCGGIIGAGGIMYPDNHAIASEKTPAKISTESRVADSGRSIDPKPVLAFIKAIGEFDNTPGNDKARLRAKHQDMQRLSPAFKSTVKLVMRELKAKGNWNTVDDFLYKEAAKDKLPAQLIAEVRSAGGPKAIFENMDRYVDEDIKNRLGRTALNEGTIFDSFEFVGTAHAVVNGCNIAAWIAYGSGKLFYLATGKDYSENAVYNNYRWCTVY